jgi:TPP-dependent pyruvate/acetoin dehydrogenase alpha subunit
MLLKEKLFTRDQLDAVEKEIENAVRQAHNIAKESPRPERGDFLNYVFK